MFIIIVFGYAYKSKVCYAYYLLLECHFFFSRVHISDFQNPSGLTKLFMIILILVLKFIFKFHPVVCVATELNEKLFLIYSNEQLILLLKCLTTVAVLSNMTKLAGIFLILCLTYHE